MFKNKNKNKNMKFIKLFEEFIQENLVSIKNETLYDFINKKVSDIDLIKNDFGIENRNVALAEKVDKGETDFQAFYDARKYLKDEGYSVGNMERDSPIGFKKGNYKIEKWRNLDDSDKDELDGILYSDNWRSGDVYIIYFTFPLNEADDTTNQLQIELINPQNISKAKTELGNSKISYTAIVVEGSTFFRFRSIQDFKKGSKIIYGVIDRKKEAATTPPK